MTWLPLILIATGLVGCGDRDASKVATQVAAKVNKGEISVHQINTQLSRFGGLTEPQTKQASQQILEKLIDQELLVQKALEAKLDRDPKVLQAIEASRRQLLAQAYVERATAAASKASPEETQAFYNAHPELFAQRRIYRLQELAINVRGEQAAKLREEAGKARSLNDIARWASAAGVRFTANATVKPAEQLPLEVLPKIHAAKDGQILLLPGQNSVVAVQVAGSQAAPLSEKEATPYIEQFLQNQQKQKIATTEVQQLRGAATLEYVGEYAKMAAAKPMTEPAAAKPASEAAARPATESATSGSQGGGFVSKGLSGLK